MDKKLLFLFALTITGVYSMQVGGVLQKMIEFNRREKREVLAPPVMQSLHISSVITSRFSDVEMISRVFNKEPHPQKFMFQAQLPKTAFISNFSMIIDNTTYVGVVKETEIAVREYAESESRGETAGLVKKTSGRETQWFEISVNIKANSDVVFKLQYQELLMRQLGLYKHTVFADIQRGLEEFKLDVYITEPKGMKNLVAHKPYEGSAVNARKDNNFHVETRQSRVQAKICYEVDTTIFEEGDSHSRRFLVEYDAERGAGNGGDLQIYENCFAHFFAPDLPSMSKRIVFVIDTSGSMMGKKMEQTKSAFKSILSEVRDIDKLNIVSFSGRVRMWDAETLKSVEEQVRRDAKEFVNDLHATGSTNLYGGLEAALRLLGSGDTSLDGLGQEYTDMIILLTDGNPTAGIQDTHKIVQKTVHLNKREIPIYCLGFGGDVDHEFLKKLAEQNYGKSRRIYEDSDAELQLQGFYNEVASPLLSDISIDVSGNVLSLTKSRFSKYFQGSELVVMGKVSPDFEEDFDISVNGISSEGEFNEVVTGNMIPRDFSYPVEEGISNRMDSFCERMWAYLTINQLVKKKDLEEDSNRKNEYQQEIIRLALKFNFVTPLTSMIARKPGNVTEKTVVEEREPTVPTFVPRMPHHNSLARMYGPMAHSPIHSVQSIQTFSGTMPRYYARSGTMPRYYGRISHRGTFGPAAPSFSWNSMLTTTSLTRPATTTTTTTPTPTTTTTTTSIQSSTAVPVSHPLLRELDVEATCGEEIELGASENRTITSPNYPHLYHRNTACKWVVSSEHPFTLRVDDIDLEEGVRCSHDRVMVYIRDHNSAKPRVLCGFDKERSYRAQNTMTIVFVSDDSVQGTGFRGTLSLD